MINFADFDFFILSSVSYVAPLFDKGLRLNSITGFTGSYGLVFLSEKHQKVFFTDGRYLLQASYELTDDFLIKDIKELSSWLKSNVDKKFAFDPRLYDFSLHKFFTKNQVKDLNIEDCDKFYDSKNVQINTQQFLIKNYPTEYSGADTLNKIRNFFQNCAIEYFLITDPENIAWLLNIYTDFDEFNHLLPGCLLINKNAIDLFVIDNLFVDNLDSKINLHNINELENFLQNKNIQNISVDKNTCSFYLGNIIKNLDIEVTYQEDPIYKIRSIKNHVEIANSKDIHVQDGLAKTKFLLWILDNAINGALDQEDEFSLSEKLLAYRQQNKNFIKPSFDSIVGSGANSAIIHYAPKKNNSSVIKKNSILLIDSGGHYLGGTTDCTRTVFVGNEQEISKEQKKYFTAILKSNIFLQNAKFPENTPGKALDYIAHYYLWQQEESCVHSIGHGVSNFLNVHELPPRISRNSEDVIQENMIISNEPGIYFAHKYGIRIENLMLVIKKSSMLEFECLTKVPIDLRLVDFGQLSSLEKEWLLNYNNEVFILFRELFTAKEKMIYQKFFLVN